MDHWDSIHRHFSTFIMEGTAQALSANLHLCALWTKWTKESMKKAVACNNVDEMVMVGL